MATTIYKFRPHENLSLIAKRYHTDIKTLTMLNSWLINPHTGKTEMFPSKVNYVYTQNNSVVQNILLEKPAKPGTVKMIMHANADGSGSTATWADDSCGHIKTMNGTGDIKYTINYNSRHLSAENLMSFNTNWKSVTIEYTAALNKDYLVVPLIGNGNTSIEDYWENVDKVTGISLNKLMNSLATDDRHLLSTSTMYAQTDNGQVSQATLDMVGTALLDVDTNSGTNSHTYETESTPVFNGSTQGGSYTENAVTDFTTARVGGIVQTAINEGSKNMRDYFLYDFDHINNGTYGATPDPYKSDGTFLTTAQVRNALNKSTAGGYTAALYVEDFRGVSAKNRGPLNFHSYSNGLYGDLDSDLDANTVITAQNQRWSRDKRSLYKYQTIGTQRDNSILQAVEVIIGNSLIYMPCWPENVQDGAQADYDTPAVLGRSAPYVIYTKTGERTIEFTFKLHREMLDTPVAILTEDIIKNPNSVASRANEIDKIVRLIESAVYPDYDGTVAAVRTQVKIGNSIYISGVMTSQSTNWYGPIGSDYKYKQCDITFSVLEVTNSPKSSTDIAQIGGWRTS